jgi:hypothetical protein
VLFLFLLSKHAIIIAAAVTTTATGNKTAITTTPLPTFFSSDVSDVFPLSSGVSGFSAERMTVSQATYSN